MHWLLNDMAAPPFKILSCMLMYTYVFRVCSTMLAREVWQALSGVLHLSTVSFHETDHPEGPVAGVLDRKVSLFRLYVCATRL